MLQQGEASHFIGLGTSTAIASVKYLCCDQTYSTIKKLAEGYRPLIPLEPLPTKNSCFEKTTGDWETKIKICREVTKYGRFTAAAGLHGESETSEKGLGLGLLMHLHNTCSKFDYSTQ